MNIVYFTKSWPRRNSGALLEKSCSLVESLINENMEITVCSEDEAKNKTYMEQCQVKLVEIGNKNRVKNLMSSRLKPQAFIFDGFATQQAFSAFGYAKFNKTPRILEVNHLPHLEKWRKRSLQLVPSASLIPFKFPMHNMDEIVNEEEMRSLVRSDYLVAGSEYIYYLLKKLGFDNCTYFSYGFPLTEYRIEINNLEWRPWRDRKGFVFYGDLQKETNRSSLDTLIQRIWPKIRVSLPDSQLYIYGSNHYPMLTQQKTSLEEQNIIYKGYSEEISVISQHKCLLYPCTYSTGVRSKIIEGWFNHLPTVTTKMGAEGQFYDSYDPFLSMPERMGEFLGERKLTEEEQKSMNKIKQYYDGGIYTKQELTFGGSCDNFTVDEFVQSAIRMEKDEKYWNQCMKNAHNSIFKNQNDQFLSTVIKNTLTKAELSAYQSRSRPAYKKQWKRYIETQQFQKKIR